MATFTTNPNQAARFDFFDIGALGGKYVYASTPNIWRLGNSKADSGTDAEFLGAGFTYTGGALTGGTIQSIATHNAGALGFQIAGMSMSAATFNGHMNAANPLAFLGAVFSGNDTMTGSDLVDALYGFAGKDYLEGKGGNDVLDGGTGADTLAGGLGNDLYVIDNTGDVVVESGKNTGDSISATISIDLTKMAYDGVEHVTLTGSANLAATGDSFVNHLKGNIGANKLSGGGGNDDISGLGGNDILDGGTGNDSLSGGVGNDAYYVDTSLDLVIEFENGKDAGGTDTVFSSADTYIIYAGVENLTLIDAAVTGIGNDSANTLTGNAEKNYLYGKGGADTLIGGAGNDEYYVDSAKDTVIETSSGGTRDIVFSSANAYTLPTHVEWLFLSNSGGAAGTGNSVDNHLYGNDEDNTLDGAAGDDVISGRAGNDVLIGGLGNDSIYGGTGINTIDTGPGDDYVLYEGGLDVVQNFDGNWTGGQDRMSFRFYFDKLNVADEDRAGRINISQNGSVTDIWLDYDGNGSFDFQVAEIHTVDLITIGQDIFI